MTVAPLSPQEAREQKHTIFPDKVIEVINRLILKHLINGEAVVKKDEIVAELERQGYEKKEIGDNGWLDFETMYEDAGWDVVYDKPGYCESYDANYTFTEKEADNGKAHHPCKDRTSGGLDPRPVPR